MITSTQYETAAKLLNVTPRIIKTVAAVESNGGGFYKDGRLVLLFEPHIFYRQLVAFKVDPGKYMKMPRYRDIVYPKWKTYAYPYPSVLNWERVGRAMEIHNEAALRSASWGMFQAMGFNFHEMEYGSAQEMVEDFKKGEYNQLMAFVKMIKRRKLDVALRKLDWVTFARSYNGEGYDDAPGRANDYDVKLENQYNLLG